MPPLVLRYSRSIFLPRTFRPFQSLLPLLPTFSSHTSWHRHTFPPRFAATLIPRRRPDQIWAQTLAEEIVDVMELDFEDLKEYKGHANAVKEMARGESFGAAGARAVSAECGSESTRDGIDGAYFTPATAAGFRIFLKEHGHGPISVCEPGLMRGDSFPHGRVLMVGPRQRGQRATNIFY